MNTEATHDQHEKHTTGVRLRNAREQLGLSQQAVAERLCLKVSTVRDIEEDKKSWRAGEHLPAWLYPFLCPPCAYPRRRTAADD